MERADRRDNKLMEELDADGSLLKDYRGKYASRDLVQFVRFKECIRRGNLAEEVLREVPEQFCFYMEGAGVKP